MNDKKIQEIIRNIEATCSGLVGCYDCACNVRDGTCLVTRLKELSKEPVENKDGDDMIDKIQELLGIKCNCLTKNPEPMYHKVTCPVWMNDRIKELEKEEPVENKDGEILDWIKIVAENYTYETEYDGISYQRCFYCDCCLSEDRPHETDCVYVKARDLITKAMKEPQ